ncbi:MULTISPECIES: ATP-binding cassette domain-containing protein [Rhizobium/Agrobacterium group]|uniref:ABC transporter nucleotide binding/ATPase protein (Sugar) n=3 Tax=Rhizobiaceae TaxID=82115 RepID=B9K3J0_ALLAM|nr:MULTISPECIES: ATP-binding cassette domain-containing protein [Rhizobium/Agrobacterium group]ACM39438.1 ABC transporter nucleotide binding/ATPase protein (sugar) [Allorhizobium ampelinum S4]MCF1449040.1 sugar ABC transporter ATP-binding protein [Allorhizobium ampelinum]MUO31239.1 ATP-binding cassette domain-containing protein [Agrobacterium vitis]MUO44932.1 ATP-binding cassette domain-containing protein [Agrobacterium vitis]MUP12945.1 ATP-binding cassette domain-containing protein [Agrobacte
MIRLSATNLRKNYGPTRALAGLSMELSSGDIVGLAGPNGAGKSTLTRMLAGEELPDSGSIILERDGRGVDRVTDHVAVVHQEPQVWPNLTVLENLAVGREASAVGSPRPKVDPSPALKLLELERFAHYQLSDLSLAVQQRVEIARAIMYEADIFLFDEPNSALTDEESKSLFSVMRRLADAGKIVLLITHRLEDFVNSCGRVLVLRDGTIQGDLSGDRMTEMAIVRELTHGLSLTEATSRATGRQMPPDPSFIVSLNSCSDPAGSFDRIDLNIVPGTVTIVAGVEGSGARELVRALGRYSPISGNLNARRKDGNEIAVSYVAASRRSTVFPNLSVGDNLVARLNWSSLCSPIPFLSRSKIAARADAAVKKYFVKTASIDHPITSLSGGNQQKVVVSAAVEYGAELLVIEEPTRGVDFSSKRDIYAILRDYAAKGNAVVLFCTEVPEMYEVGDEVVVVSHGRIMGNAAIDEHASATQLTHRITELESGHSTISERA